MISGSSGGASLAKLREGRQAYVITPRVEDGGSEELASVEEEYEQLANGPLEAFRVDLIDGRMSPAEKRNGHGILSSCPHSSACGNFGD